MTSQNDLSMIIREEGLTEAIRNTEPRILIPHLNRGMKQTTLHIRGEMVKEAPTGADGELRRAVKGVVGPANPVISWVGTGSSVFYAPFVAAGRKAGGKFPPFGPDSSLARWVRLVQRPPVEQLRSRTFLLARKIAKRGIDPNPYHERAKVNSRPGLRRIWRGVNRRIARQIATGRP